MSTRPNAQREVQVVQRMLSRERLAIDEAGEGRTTFLSHLGAQSKLAPGPWIAHRDLLFALALANLSPAQRTSLARAVMVEYGREFGVGRLVLEAVDSGLPLGGSSLLLRPRPEGLRCLYTWALGSKPQAVPCDWLLLRAQPQWAEPESPPTLRAKGLATLAAIGGEVVVFVADTVMARQVADLCRDKVPVAAHPRFAPHIEGQNPEASVLLWPQDALEGAGLRRRALQAAVVVSAPESVRTATAAWLKREGLEKVDMVDATAPGRATRKDLAAFWKACGQPRILLRGDPAWVRPGAQWLESLGAEVQVQGAATQLNLL